MTVDHSDGPPAGADAGGSASWVGDTGPEAVV
jgi:hypothetical protein